MICELGTARIFCSFLKELDSFIEVFQLELCLSNGDIGMIKDARDHRGIAVFGHPLEFMEEIVVVIVEAHRQPLQDRGWQIRGRAAPLLDRIALEEGLVEVATDEAQRLLLEGLRIGDSSVGLRLDKGACFVRPKGLAEELVDRGFKATALHGDMSQEARERSMDSFRAGRKDILVATEVAARGIDVDDVTHVINYTVPEDEKAYLHRTGRTGRAGRLGVAVTFVDWEDMARWTHINRELDLGIPEPAETYSSSAHLFEDLGIPSGTKGRIAKSTRSDDRPAQSLESKGAGDRNRAQRDRSDRGDSRGRARQKQGDRGPERRTGSSSGATNDESASKGETHGGHEHKRPNINRQRTRGGKN